jgi:hypothetical protein
VPPCASGLVAERLGTDENPELERHVEARQGRIAVGFGPGEVMDREAAPFDDVVDLRDPDLGTVVRFAGGPGNEAALDHGKSKGLEQRPILGVERTVD